MDGRYGRTYRGMGSNFQNEFFGGVLLIFDLSGVEIKIGFYYLGLIDLEKK